MNAFLIIILSIIAILQLLIAVPITLLMISLVEAFKHFRVEIQEELLTNLSKKTKKTKKTER